MIISAWHWKPSSVLPIKQAAEAHFDYRDLSFDWNWRWKSRKVTFAIDGQWSTPAAAAQRLIEVPVLTWWNVYHTSAAEGAPPEFHSNSINGHGEMIKQAKIDLKKAGLPPSRLNRINHILDDENGGPYYTSKFARFDDNNNMIIGKESYWEWPTNVPHIATSNHLFGRHLKNCDWQRLDGTVVCNYMTNHGPIRAEYGVAPYYRSTPFWVPGSLDQKTTFITGYWTGGPDGCLTEAEVMDVIKKAPAPIVLALDDYQPGRANILIEARKSRKVKIVLLWRSSGPKSVAEKDQEIANDIEASYNFI